MQKAFTSTISVLGLACITALVLSACTLSRNSESVSVKITGNNSETLRGKSDTRRVDAESHYLMGCNFQARGKHHLAIQEFQMAVMKDPRHVKAYNGMGISLDASREYEKAVTAYTAALAIDPNLDYVLNNLGYSYLLQNRFDLAIETFEKAIALNPVNARYRNNLGLAYFRNENFEAALAEFEASGDEAQAHLNIAHLYYRNGLYAKAEVHFAQASTLKPADNATDKGLAASASLAQIHAASSKAEDNTHKPLSHKSETVTASYGNDGFYTIPAGIIEDLPLEEIHPVNLADQNDVASDQERDEEPIHTATLVRIASPEEERVASRKLSEAVELKILDENQALELLNREVVDTEIRPQPRIKIEVSNGNGVTRMARRVGHFLRDKGFILMYLSNAKHFNYPETSIRYTRGYLREAYRLSQELPGLQSMEEVSAIKGGNAEISILIGRDLTPYLSMFQEG